MINTWEMLPIEIKNQLIQDGLCPETVIGLASNIDELRSSTNPATTPPQLLTPLPQIG